MEDSKYYTPSIDEFYVGFEYEYFNTFSDKYEIETVTVDDIVERPLFEGIELNKKTYSLLRVKYLDKSDIESCGFTSNQGWEWEFRYKINMKLPGYSYEDYVGLGYCPDTKLMYIGTSGMTVFDGIIKNLSELRKLLKQIGISDTLTKLN